MMCHVYLHYIDSLYVYMYICQYVSLYMYVCMYMYVIYLHTHLSSVVNVITLLCIET